MKKTRRAFNTGMMFARISLLLAVMVYIAAMLGAFSREVEGCGESLALGIGLLFVALYFICQSIDALQVLIIGRIMKIKMKKDRYPIALPIISAILRIIFAVVYAYVGIITMSTELYIPFTVICISFVMSIVYFVLLIQACIEIKKNK